MKVSTLAIMAITSLTLAKPIPDGDDGDNNIVPIRWNDIEAGAYAAQSSVSASASTTPTLAARHIRGQPIQYPPKSGTQQPDHHGGSGLWGRDNSHKHDHEVVNVHVHQNQNQNQDQHKHDPSGNENGKGGKSGAEGFGDLGGKGLWGRSPNPEPKKKHGGGNGKGNGKPDGGIVGANVFDNGGNHRNDPSWG